MTDIEVNIDCETGERTTTERPAPADPVIPVEILRADAKGRIKARRDAILKTYSERLVIYQANFDAASAVLSGVGADVEMQSGKTADSFAADNAAAMGLPSASAWANYIVGEWRNLGTFVDQMEREYLRLTYNQSSGLDALSDSAQVKAAAAAFFTAFGGE